MSTAATDNSLPTPHHHTTSYQTVHESKEGETEHHQQHDIDLNLPLPMLNQPIFSSANEDLDSLLLTAHELAMPTFDKQGSGMSNGWNVSNEEAAEKQNAHLVANEGEIDARLLEHLDLPLALTNEPATASGDRNHNNGNNDKSKGEKKAKNAFNVKECPAWVERHTSFRSKASPPVILQRCSTALATTHADFVTNPSKHKIKGVAYVNGSIVHFVCRVYRGASGSGDSEHLAVPGRDATSSGEQEYIVEFQKRNGCAMAFNALYRDVIAQMTDIYFSNMDGDSALPPLTSLSRAISQVEDSDNELSESADEGEYASSDPHAASPTPEQCAALQAEMAAEIDQQELGASASPVDVSQPASPLLPEVAASQPLNHSKKMSPGMMPRTPTRKAAKDYLESQHVPPMTRTQRAESAAVFGTLEPPRKVRQTTATIAMMQRGLAPQEGSSNSSVTTLSDNTLCSLLSMALSDDSMSAREAVNALSGLPAKVVVEAVNSGVCDETTGECNISMHGLVNALTRALDGTDSQLTRSAAVLLANLSEEPEFSNHVVHSDDTVTSNSVCGGGENDHLCLVDQVFTLLNFPTCFSARCDPSAGDCGNTGRFPALMLRDIKRQVAKALSNLASLQPTAVLNMMIKAKQLGTKVDYRHVLEKYQMSPCADPRLNHFVTVAMERLNMVQEK